MPGPRLCRACEFWYGGEDKGFGPCRIKTTSGIEKFITYGLHECDEGYYAD